LFYWEGGVAQELLGAADAFLQDETLGRGVEVGGEFSGEVIGCDGQLAGEGINGPRAAGGFADLTGDGEELLLQRRGARSGTIVKHGENSAEEMGGNG